MKFLIEKLNFTKSELKVIVFLISVLFIGLCIKITKGVAINDEFDYSKTDKMFQDGLNRLAAMDDSSGTIDTSVFTPEERNIIRNVKTAEDTLRRTSRKSKKEDLLKGKFVNLNTAAKEQLVQLPGIGESTAEKIIKYRTERGKFTKTEDIMKIKGIGKKKFEKLKEYIVTE